MGRKKKEKEPKIYEAINGKKYKNLETANLVSIVTFIERYFGNI